MTSIEETAKRREQCDQLKRLRDATTDRERYSELQEEINDLSLSWYAGGVLSEDEELGEPEGKTAGRMGGTNK